MAVLLVAAFGAFLAFLDSTIVNIAFPAIQRYFHQSDISGVGFLEWHQIDVAREAGRIATREVLPRIMAVVAGGGACG